MTISGAKWGVMVALAVISIILGFLPYYIIRRLKATVKADSLRYKLTVTVFSCFGAGVLLVTALMHMLPEVREAFKNLEDEHSFDSHFPLAEMIVLVGFAIIYLLEETAHFIMVDGHHGHHHHHSTVARHNSIAHGIPVPNSRGSVIRTGDESNKVKILEEGLSLGCEQEKAGKEECPDDENTMGATIRSVLAIIALSFHAVMEGIAIGIQNSTELWFMFGAIAAHKFVISFCMGLELVTANASKFTYISSVLVFGVLSSVGIAIGSVIQGGEDNTRSMPVTVIEGIATGTILYVVFFEILNRERERKTFGMKTSKAIGFIQFLSIMAGLVAMGCLLTFVGEHDHGVHEEEECHDHDHKDHRFYPFATPMENRTL